MGAVKVLEIIKQTIEQSDADYPQIEGLSVMKLITTALRPKNRKKLGISSDKPLKEVSDEELYQAIFEEYSNLVVND